MSIPDHPSCPRLLVIDDLFGRTVLGGLNEERADLCARLLIRDITGDSTPRAARRQVANPRAEAVFIRGQTPRAAVVGDTVENSIESCLEAVQRGWRPSAGVLEWSLVLVDLCFYTGRVTAASHHQAAGMPEGRPGDDRASDYFGLKVIAALRQQYSELPIVILSSMSRDEVSRQFSELGALGFVPRSGPDSPEVLDELLWQHGLLGDSAGEVVGNSLQLLLALREARRAARHRENLLIRAERGSGKELLARYVHRASVAPKASGGRPFVTVNSAQFSPSLFAADLFGIEPRTATGVDGKVGLIEMAHHGDLFLDEIADMHLEAQAAILRVLQERQVTRVGSRQPREVDVRFLSATNADVEEASRGIRSDLLDRLRAGGTIWIPALRERPTDIPLLVEGFVRQAEAQRKGSLRRDVTPAALDALQAYYWPGNVRELRSAVFDAVYRFPHVEHLVPIHLRLTSVGGEMATIRSTGADPGPTVSTPYAGNEEASLDSLLARLAKTQFDHQRVGEWAGRLGDLQREQSRLMARMLGVAMEVTKRRTPDRPEGIVQIHPALRLLTGDSDLTASKAADLCKRLLGPLEDELEGDLLAAYETAVRLRPKSVRGVPGKAVVSRE